MGGRKKKFRAMAAHNVYCVELGGEGNSEYTGVQILDGWRKKK